LLGAGGRSGGPGDGTIHHPPHLGEPPIGPLHPALPGQTPAPPPSGNSEFQLIELILFDFIYVAHKDFPFVMRTTLRGAVGQRLSNQKNIFFFFLARIALKWGWIHAHRVS
jgi:hypothetical protein